MKKPNCTDEMLWNKLSEQDQKMWVKLFKMFKKELDFLSSIENTVKAHNLAYIDIDLSHRE